MEGERLETACLAFTIVGVSLLLWIGVPAAGVWIAVHVIPDEVVALLLALLVIPPAMAGVGWVLGRVSARYEELRGRGPDPAGPPAWRTSLSEARGGPLRQRRLVDAAMTLSACLAMVLFAVWFLFFANFPISPLK